MIHTKDEFGDFQLRIELGHARQGRRHRPRAAAATAC
jgi:hypothetical protein